MTGRQGRAASVAEKRNRHPDSPCISVCALDDLGRCLGCGRTLDQIARWGIMSVHEQWAVIDEINARAAV